MGHYNSAYEQDDKEEKVENKIDSETIISVLRNEIKLLQKQLFEIECELNIGSQEVILDKVKQFKRELEERELNINNWEQTFNIASDVVNKLYDITKGLGKEQEPLIDTLTRIILEYKEIKSNHSITQAMSIGEFNDI